jgi:hypothetical protein
MTIGPDAAVLFHAEIRTDRHVKKIAAALRNVANAPKNQPVDAIWGNNHCSEIHTKHINILCVCVGGGVNINLLIVQHGGAYSNH